MNNNNGNRLSNTNVNINHAEEVQNENNEEPPASFVVSILEDENDGDFSEGDLSLREAIALSNEREGTDAITFNSNLNGGEIVLDSSLGRDFNLDEDLSINGLGQDNLTLNGSFVFNVASDTDVIIDGLNFVGGTIDNSGNLTFSNSTISETANINGSSDYYAIISREGNTDIVGSTIKDNSGGSSVGVVIESGTASIENSAITDNDATAHAQAGVIIRSDATVNITNSTIANNTGRSNGGIENAGTVNITNSTIANNTGGLSAGGINNFGNTGGRVTLTSSILTNNTGSSNIGDVSGDGEFISGGNNLISNGDDAVGFVDGVNGDRVGSNGDDPLNPQNELLIDPQLGELQNNGGLTETFALLEGSPAIDAGSNPNNLATDQRGEEFDRTVGSSTDIGAYEVQDTDVVVPTEFVVSTLEDENDGNFSEGDLSLREAIALSNEQDGADIITFDESLNGGTISIDESLDRQLTIDDSVAIDGLGQDNFTLDGGFIFDVESNVDLTIRDLNLIGGKIDSSGNLTLSNSTISQTMGIEGNSADNSAIISRGTANIIDSTIRDNNTGNSAGNTGIFIESGTATIESSTIADNQAQSISGIIIGSEATVDLINSTVAGSRSRSIGGIQNDGTLNIVNSTVSDNGGGEVGGINNNGIVTATSSIIANNNNEDNFTDIVGDGELVSGGNNLVGNGDNANGFIDSDLVGTANNLVDPNLGELQNNGGSTATFALLDGSLAIDAGSNPNNLATDQRGEGFDRTVGNGTDIGAFEVQTISSNDDLVGTDNSDFLQGTVGNDRIFGLGSADFIEGLDGDDFLSGGDGNDYLQGGNGADTVEGDAGNDLIEGGTGFNILRGGDGHDRILGGAEVDTIDDGAGNDVLLGGDSGDRFLASNPGHDLFTGGNGNDFYVYNINPDAGFFDRDRILDFNQSEDRVAFRPFVNDLATFDEFADLDTNGSGVLDSDDARIQIIDSATIIDFSNLFGRDLYSDTITLVGVTNLDESNFLFNETVVGTEFG